MKRLFFLIFLSVSISALHAQNETASARLKNFTIINVPSQLVFVTKDEVNIREEPSLNAPRMEQNFGLGYYMAYRGVYQCLGSRNGWYNIIIPPTTLDGWVSGSLAKPVSNNPIDWTAVKDKAFRMSAGYARVAMHQETGLALMEFRSRGDYNTPIYTDLYLGKQVKPNLIVFFQSKRIYDKQAGYNYANDAALRNYAENHQVRVQAETKDGGWFSFDLEAIPSSLLLRVMGAPEREISADLGCEFVTADVLTSTTMMAQTTPNAPKLIIDTLKCKLSKKEDYLSLSLSLEYPISGPERMMRTLRDTILTDICYARSFVVDDIRKDEIARTWDELPIVLWKSLTADWKELEEDGTVEEDDMSPYCLDVSLNCIASTSSYATFKLLTGLFPYGAAHPNYNIFLYTVDAKSGHLLTPNDIFRNPESEALEELIYQELCRQNEGIEDELEGEDYDGAVPIPGYKGIVLLPQGILIMYDPYEIGSYALGTPECLIPIAKIRHLLTPYALRLLENK